MEPLFDHEKLDVYCVELGFVAWIAAFLDDASKSAGQHRRELIEQLDRASLSVLLNTAEGNGKRQGRQRARFFDDARGSALECADCLDAAIAESWFPSIVFLPAANARACRSDVESLIDRFGHPLAPSSVFIVGQSWTVSAIWRFPICGPKWPNKQSPGFTLVCV